MVAVSKVRTKDGVWLDYEEDGKAVQRRMTYRLGSKVRPDEYPPFGD